MVLNFGGLGGGEDESDTQSGDDLMGGADEGLMGDDAMFAEDEDEDSEMEITYKLDEIEKEVDSLENQVETVRSENERISDSISTVERNVDKLVDLYEIVTEGVNPFAADQEIGNAFDTDGGIFTDDDDDLGEAIDDDLVDAEADEFLDDEIADDEDDETFGDEFDDDGSFEDGIEDDEFGADPDDAFEDESVDEETTVPLELDDDTADGDLAASDDVGSDEPDRSAVDALALGENGEVGDPPYLATQPSRNDAELMTIEWLDFLVETVGVSGAAQTLAYYESVGWISAPVETYLQSMLNGFGDDSQPATELATDPEPRSVLETDEHKRSLQYIAWIATPEQAPELLVDSTPEDALPIPGQ
ncbi:FlaD/FlaE family flagellar protein [Halostagnicola kamekurae]|uniref:Flagella accessory protein C (FlaC) n=1 Tax=Halostagnicola kamekurae TaxID=619731 RepID=A0A1I6RK68_9EURY|nr:FlaD/FlaE family flagellar protein [Halostagnicola kamekurae]SFS65121.1 Flagella accessory protein C (FlaC) [Halostagnicola kamekurae]